jgi:hypothetical protein
MKILLKKINALTRLQAITAVKEKRVQIPE